jgi:tetratricopeptide (TPR) repeat protein
VCGKAGRGAPPRDALFPLASPGEGYNARVPFWRAKPYDRTTTLDAAHRARARGDVAKAIRLYGRVIENDPGDLVAHARIAPLLALRRRDRGRALASFQLAAGGHERSGFCDRAIAVYSQAAAFFPREASLWESLARLEETRGRRRDAHAALVEGASHLARRRATWAEGERLLRRAATLDPGVLVTVALARIVARQRRRDEALALLEEAARRAAGPDLRRVRRAQFLVAPSLGRAWRWLSPRRRSP